MTKSDANQKLLAIHRRRLAKLKEQAAMFGANTPPHISIEIEDITAEIHKLEGDTLTSSSEKTASKSDSGTTIIVQGDGNVIATDGGVAVGGDVQGDISSPAKSDE